MLGTLHDRFERWLFEPRGGSASRLARFGNAALRYSYALIRDLTRGDLTLRAMSLVYTTLLSIVPLLALSFSVLKGLGYHRELEPVLYEFLAPLGERSSEITTRIIEFVDNIQGGVLGSIGLAILIYTVVSMVQKIEESFNFVWRVEQPRSFGRRVSEYLSVMVLGPVMIVVAMGLLASLASNEIVQRIASVEPVGSLVLGAGRLVPYLIVTGVFTFLYVFVPNTRVRFRAALIAGLVAAFLWVAVGGIFASFVAVSGRTTAIYAGFAVVIVALLWLYANWLVLLIGALLAFYLQNPQLLRQGREELLLDSKLREQLALGLMGQIATHFVAPSGPLTLDAIATRLGIPQRALGPVARALERKGLLIVTDAEGLVPGRAMDTIRLREVVDAVRHDPASDAIRAALPGNAGLAARELESAIDNALGQRTLRDLID
ncbi:MAG TPA: YhjD/YihY/BrkB family envelope integrity protein [Steroidobacteraceae bacterium]|nr:YhjD/YihY/BrkB family envelope integrity protein [Steroidobacteraceae bacterium]